MQVVVAEQSWVGGAAGRAIGSILITGSVSGGVRFSERIT